MTLATTTARMDYVGTGTTGPFSYTFRVLDEDDLEVTVRDTAGAETSLVYPTDFSVTGVRNRSGGTITLTTALAVGETLTIRRVMAIRQTTDLRNLGAFLPDVIEDQLDRGIMIDQQLFDGLERSLRYPVSVDPDAVSAELPVPSPDLVLGWNSAGTALENKPLASSDNVVLPGGGRTVATLTNYLANNVVFNILDFNPSPATPLTTGLNSVNAAVVATLAALPTKGGQVLFPPGRFLQTANIEVTPDATAFDGGYIELVGAPGAKLLPSAAVTEAISFNHAVAQEAWVGATNLVIDGGSNALVGFGIHAPNVKLRAVTAKYCKTAGIKYFSTLAPSYPICSELTGPSLLYNKVGIHCTVSASGFKLIGGRIEGSDEEGVLLQDMGHFSLSAGAVVEMNGNVDATKPNLRIKGVCYGSVVGCYFESRAFQDHSCVVVESVSQQPRAILFTGNIVTGYYETASGSGVPLLNSVGLDIAPGASGVVDGLVEFGNIFFGQHIGVRNGTFSRGFKLGPDAFSDSFDDGTVWSAVTAYVPGNKVNLGTPGTNYACILANTNQTPPNATYWLKLGTQRYVRTSVLAGRVEDVNAYANTIYDSARHDTLNATSLHVFGVGTFDETIVAAGGVKYTGGLNVDGSTTKNATFGLLQRAVAGSVADAALVNPGGAGLIYQVPTGSLAFQFGGSTVEKTATIVYSASMTPNADAGNIQTITANNGTAFTINAPTNPRLGQRLRIRLKNIHSGALGAITANAVYKLAGGAWPSPMNGFHRSIEFDYDGTWWQEAFRTPADVPN